MSAEKSLRLLKNLRVGCDPEVFVFNVKTQEHVSAHGLLPGTKDRPHDVKDGMVQVDGMAAEFGIDPAPDEKTFVRNIRSVMRQLQAMLPKDHIISVKSTASFSKEIMDAQPPEALELGCEPDFNCYTGRENPTPDATDKLYRTGGGHVHVGWGGGMDVLDPTHLQDCQALVAEMDYQLGIPSLHWDGDFERRTLYGAPGAFRPKPYGLEYRSLSNQWLLKEEYVRYVFRQTKAAYKAMLDNTAKSKRLIPLYGGAVKLEARQVMNLGQEVGSEFYGKNV